LRLITRELTWPDYVALAFEDLVAVGSFSTVVARRLLAVLEDLIDVAPVERRPPLEAQRRGLLRRSADAGVAVAPDVSRPGAAENLTSGA
jgi:hypothetical protein